MRTYHVGVVLLAAASLTGCTDRIVSTAGDTGTDRTGRNRHGVEGFAVAGEQRTGYILGYDGRPMKVTFEVHDGRAIFEGDIDIGPADSIPLTPDPLLRAGGPRYGVVRSSSTYRWPNGVVHYAIDPNLPSQWRVTDAIAYVQSQVAGVQFAQRTNQSNYVYFTTGSGCASSVGRVGGAQNVTLASNCTTGNTIHEIGHVLGMYHEHTRCDRDTYVTINWGNIESGKASNFDKQCSGATDVFAYSEASVMHYAFDAFGVGSSTTISSNRGLGGLMGQRDSVTQSDRSSINWMYRPYAPGGLSLSYPSGVPTMSWNSYVGAVQYQLVLNVVFEEYDYERGFSTWDYPQTVGYTTGTSIQDSQNSYTGIDYCEVENSTYTSSYYLYRYEVYAKLPDGIWSHAAQVPAYVATC